MIWHISENRFGLIGRELTYRELIEVESGRGGLSGKRFEVLVYDLGSRTLRRQKEQGQMSLLFSPDTDLWVTFEVEF